KLRWCLDEISAVSQARVDKRLALGPLSSYLLHALLEEHPYVVDPANASRTQLWDPRTRDWSQSLAALFGVPSELLPRCVHSRGAFGQLSFWGKQIPLVVCTGDQSAALFAFGALDPATIYLNMGTGAFLQCLSNKDDPRLLSSVSYSDGQRFMAVQEGTVNGAAAAIDWLNERIGIDTHRAARALQRAKAEAESPLFSNGLGGVGSQDCRTNVTLGCEDEGCEASHLQRCHKSSVFLICRNIELMRDESSARVLASGGVSSSNNLCQCIATLSGLQVPR